MHPIDYRKHLSRNNFSKFVICISICTLNRHALSLAFCGEIPVSFAICLVCSLDIVVLGPSYSCQAALLFTCVIWDGKSEVVRY